MFLPWPIISSLKRLSSRTRLVSLMYLPLQSPLSPMVKLTLEERILLSKSWVIILLPNYLLNIYIWWRFTGQISYVPITSTSPASQYWGIDQSVTYGNVSTILNSTSGIVDTGISFIAIICFPKVWRRHVRHDFVDACYRRIPGIPEGDGCYYGLASIRCLSQQNLQYLTQKHSTTGLLTVTQSQFNNLKSLFFKIGDVSSLCSWLHISVTDNTYKQTTFELTANAQIWPRALNSTLGGDSGKIYLVTADLGSNSGSGLDFISVLSLPSWSNLLPGWCVYSLH